MLLLSVTCAPMICADFTHAASDRLPSRGSNVDDRKVPTLRASCSAVLLQRMHQVSQFRWTSIRQPIFSGTVNTQVPYWQTAATGFTKAASEMQVQGTMAGPNNYDPMAEHQEFRRVVQLKPAGILVSPADPDLMRADIDAAVAAGIPVITVDADSSASKRLSFIGTNNYEAGRLGGEIVSRSLHGNGRVAIFTMPEQTNLNDRCR